MAQGHRQDRRFLVNENLDTGILGCALRGNEPTIGETCAFGLLEDMAKNLRRQAATAEALAAHNTPDVKSLREGCATIPQIGQLLAEMFEAGCNELEAIAREADRLCLDRLVLLHEKAARLAGKKDTPKRRAKLVRVQERINFEMGRLGVTTLAGLYGKTDRELAEGIAAAGK